jgi:hypothetical protein
MPTKYNLLAFSGDHKDENHVKVFTNRLMHLEKLHIDRLQHMKTLGLNNETMFFEASRGIQKISLNLEIMYYGI